MAALSSGEAQTFKSVFLDSNQSLNIISSGPIIESLCASVSSLMVGGRREYLPPRCEGDMILYVNCLDQGLHVLITQ